MGPSEQLLYHRRRLLAAQLWRKEAERLCPPPPPTFLLSLRATRSLSPPPASFGSHPPEERGPDAGVLVGGVGREECLRAMVERGAAVVRAARFDSSGPVVRADVSGYGGKEEF